MRTEASYSDTATKGIRNASSRAVEVAHECRTKNPNAEQGRVLSQSAVSGIAKPAQAEE